MNEKKIAWFVSTLGYNNRLLYWEPILEGFLESFPNTRMFTFATDCSIGSSGHRVEKAIPCVRFQRKFRNGYKGIVSIPSPLGLSKLIRSSPDLVIVSEFGLLTLYAAIYRRFFLKSRLLLLVENDPQFMPNKRSGFLARAVRRWLASQADLALTNNHLGERYLLEIVGLPAEKIKSGIYLTSQLKTNSAKVIHPNFKSPLQLLFVGRVIKSKGLFELLFSLNDLPKESRDNFTLHVVGEGDARLDLERLCCEFGLLDKIIFHGAQPYDEISSYYTTADVFILPTLTDYRALVGFEALCAGLPIIASCYDGASHEIVEEGCNGFIIDPRKPETITDKIDRLIKDRYLLKKFSVNSLERSGRFTVGKAVDNLVGACLECLK